MLSGRVSFYFMPPQHTGLSFSSVPDCLAKFRRPSFDLDLSEDVPASVCFGVHEVVLGVKLFCVKLLQPDIFH